jgi:hypothetical protein
MGKRMAAKLKHIREKLRQAMHMSIETTDVPRLWLAQLQPADKLDMGALLRPG